MPKQQSTKGWRETTRNRIEAVNIIERLQKSVLGELVSDAQAVEKLTRTLIEMVLGELVNDGTLSEMDAANAKMPARFRIKVEAVIKEFLKRQGLTAVQVNAAKILLNKRLPDYQHIEHSGNVGQTHFVALPQKSNDWIDTIEHQPKQQASLVSPERSAD